MRALVVTNMWPTHAAPQRGIFVRDQVEALQRLDDVEVEVFAFPAGPRALLRAAATIRRTTRGAGRPHVRHDERAHRSERTFVTKTAHS